MELETNTKGFLFQDWCFLVVVGGPVLLTKPFLWDSSSSPNNGSLVGRWFFTHHFRHMGTLRTLRIILCHMSVGQNYWPPQNGLDFNPYKKWATSIICGSEKKWVILLFTLVFFVVFFFHVTSQGNCKNFPFPTKPIFPPPGSYCLKVHKAAKVDRAQFRVGDGNTTQLYADYNQPFVRIPMEPNQDLMECHKGGLITAHVVWGVYPPFFGTAGLESQ